VRIVKVAAAALNQTALDWQGNADHIRAALAEAKSAKVGVLCLPELCITGYGCEDAFLAPHVHQTALSVLAELIPDTAGIVTSLGLPLFVSGAVYNTCAVCCDGALLGFVAKRALAGDGIHYEPRWFKPWPGGEVTAVRVFARDLPIGDLLFACGDVKIGFEICEDAWIAERPGADLALAGADIILNPSASHFAFGKHEIRRRLVLEGARAFGVSYLYANLLGNEAGRAIYDGDTMIASAGEVARGRRFSFADHELITATIDIDLTRTRRAWLSSFHPRVDGDGTRCLEADFDFPDLNPEPCVSQTDRWEAGDPEEPDAVKLEEFTRAECLGLLDYLRKSWSRGFVVSLSGGADSTACACLVALMVRLALEDVGRAGLARKLPHITGVADDATATATVARLLTTLFQATENSSTTTRNAARTVAEALGARFAVVEIDDLVAGYRQRTEQVLGRRLTWEQDDIALQNIQARVRSPGIWMLANVQGALLLSTSNRSEAAVGYATMDGDTSGGLSPIAGIDKAFLRRWLSWLEHRGPLARDGRSRTSMPALSVVTAQAPTAELRPREHMQTDEDDLMPYPLLDAIERAAIRDKRSPVEAYRLLRATTDYEPKELGLWVERFFKLWSRNQWKRERYAPSFHLDDENLDPKTWCRWPILSGSFGRELAALRRLVEEERGK